jgi:hypothetical protein
MALLHTIRRQRSAERGEAVATTVAQSADRHMTVGARPRQAVTVCDTLLAKRGLFALLARRLPIFNLLLQGMESRRLGQRRGSHGPQGL